MLKYLVLFFSLCPAFLNGQGKFYGDTRELNMATRLTTIPDIPVSDDKGVSGKLRDYILKNRKFSDKPLLIAGFGYSGNYSIDQLNEMATRKLGAEYNILVLCIGADKYDMNSSGVTKSRYERNWSGFLFVKTTWDEIEKNFFTSEWPFALYADKNLDIIKAYPYRVKSYSEARETLEAIHTERIVPGRLWSNKEGVIRGKDNPAAYYFEEYKKDGNRIVKTTGTKDGAIQREEFLYKDNLYYLHGTLYCKNDKGQPTASGEFKEGVPVTTITNWYPDGKVRFTIPVNGIMKVFDEKGNVVNEGPMKNGLGNGVFTSYKNGLKEKELTFRDGALYGFQKYYSFGIFEKQYFHRDGIDEFAYLSEGLQAVRVGELWGYTDAQGKMVIEPKFNSPGYFHAGVARVLGNGRVFYINTKGEMVEGEEARARLQAYYGANYTADKIADNCIKALGGREVFRIITTIKTEGTADLEYYPCRFTDMFKAGEGNFREFLFESANIKITKGLSTSDFWIQDGEGNVTPTPSREWLNLLQTNLSFSNLLEAKEKGVQLKFKGFVWVFNDIDALEVYFTMSGIDYYYRINPMSFLIMEEDRTIKSGSDYLTCKFTYKDYRKTAPGLVMPFHVKQQSYGLNWDDENRQIETVTFNEHVNAAQFARPK